jgi:hypothetical protein
MIYDETKTHTQIKSYVIQYKKAANFRMPRMALGPQSIVSVSMRSSSLGLKVAGEQNNNLLHFTAKVNTAWSLPSYPLWYFMV